MWDWARAEANRNVHPDRARENGGRQKRGPPEPGESEAHRRHRTFDERGVIEDEPHEAIRIKYRNRAGPERQLSFGKRKELPVVITLLIASILHSAPWWATAATWAFTDMPWAALVWVPIIGFSLGGRFLLGQCGVWLLGSLLLAFDGWTAWAMILPLAGPFAPGKWSSDQ